MGFFSRLVWKWYIPMHFRRTMHITVGCQSRKLSKFACYSSPEWMHLHPKITFWLLIILKNLTVNNLFDKCYFSDE